MNSTLDKWIKEVLNSFNLYDYQVGDYLPWKSINHRYIKIIYQGPDRIGIRYCSTTEDTNAGYSCYITEEGIIYYIDDTRTGNQINFNDRWK